MIYGFDAVYSVSQVLIKAVEEEQAPSSPIDFLRTTIAAALSIAIASRPDHMSIETAIAVATKIISDDLESGLQIIRVN